jgi:GTP-binding protein EngB required for normal cell division
MGLPLVLILNKCDLVPKATIDKWVAYFDSEYPGTRTVVFSNFYAVSSKKTHRLRSKVATGIDALLDVWRELELPHADEWEAKAAADAAAASSSSGVGGASYDAALFLDDENDPEFGGGTNSATRGKGAGEGGGGSGGGDMVVAAGGDEGAGTAPLAAESPNSDGGGDYGGDGDGVAAPGSAPVVDEVNKCVTIGLLGQPNVGKSTVLNSLMGQHVVQCSSTPGRTKHYQTHFMTPNIRLCDCPGLIFPAAVPRALQVLAGLYPVNQLRE